MTEITVGIAVVSVFIGLGCLIAMACLLFSDPRRRR